MRLNLEEIKIASQCFRKLHFLKQEELILPVSANLKVVQDVVDKSHMTLMESGCCPSYRQLMEWVNKRIFSQVDLKNKEAFSLAKQRTDQILNFLKIWHETVLKPEERSCYAGLTLEKRIGQHTVWSNAPVIKIDEIPIVSTVVDIDRSKEVIYNDIIVRGMCLLVMCSLDCTEVRYEEFVYGPRGGFNVNDIHVYAHHQADLEKTISHIGDIIQDEGTFPSPGKQCSSCSFQKRCVL